MNEKLDQAFAALKTYDWGVDPAVLNPIAEAVVATHTDPAARKELETRLIAVLATAVPQAAKDAVCRVLKTIGTAAAVPALAPMLTDGKLSHMARYALEWIPGPEACQALLAALPQAAANLKIGIIASLGVRGDAVPPPSPHCKPCLPIPMRPSPPPPPMLWAPSVRSTPRGRLSPPSHRPPPRPRLPTPRSIARNVCWPPATRVPRRSPTKNSLPARRPSWSKPPPATACGCARPSRIRKSPGSPRLLRRVPV